MKSVCKGSLIGTWSSFPLNSSKHENVICYLGPWNNMKIDEVKALITKGGGRGVIIFTAGSLWTYIGIIKHYIKLKRNTFVLIVLKWLIANDRDVINWCLTASLREVQYIHIKCVNITWWFLAQRDATLKQPNCKTQLSSSIKRGS